MPFKQLNHDQDRRFCFIQSKNYSCFSIGCNYCRCIRKNNSNCCLRTKYFTSAGKCFCFLDGASPEDASRLIARPLETRLRSVPGIKELSSSSRLSYARIVGEFEVGYDIDTALRDIKQAVEEVKFELPAEAEDPQIREYSFAMFPVMNLSLVGSASMRTKVFYARELQDRLESISEVLAADLEGAPEEVLRELLINQRWKLME